MTARDTIQDFLQVLKEQLDAQDACLRQWEKTDWRERLVRLDQLLHGMWRTYEEAEDVASYLKDVFPPYPFEEIKEIKRWLRDARHRIEDFLDEDYNDTESGEEYLSSYQTFLNKVCGEKHNIDDWYSHEKILVEHEREVLDMLNKSYSVLLELMLNCYQQVQKDDTNIILAYENSKARYEQLYWTAKRDKGAFLLSLEKQFPWGDPTKMQLLDFYQNKLNELKKTEIGKLYIDNKHKTFVLELAKLTLSERELHDFFREQKELEELTSIASSKEDVNVDNNPEDASNRKKKGPRVHYLFIDTKPTKENVFIKNQEKFRFMQYMKAHNFSSRELNCNKDDKVNDILTCFILHWREMKLTEENPTGGAIYRFMTEDCEFVAGVTLESYSNEMKERLKNKTYTIETYQSVAECFRKQIVT